MILLALVGCPTDKPPEPPRPNILLVLADDLGVDNVGVWDMHPGAARTPTIDALAAEGVRFHTTWGAASCSPTRAQLLTGRLSRRYGMGRTVTLAAESAVNWDLPEREITLPEALRASGYHTAFVGKWHLTSWDRDWLGAPGRHGFDTWSHVAGNLNDTPVEDLTHYYDFVRIHDGVPTSETTYATTVQTDDAIHEVTSLPEPWFVEVAYNAAHRPFQLPPQALVQAEIPEAPTGRAAYRLIVEAMDTELARLLDALDPAVRERTTIVFVGDNGTPEGATLAPIPPRQSKPSIFEGGLRVPLIVTGAGVHGRGVALGLSHVVDIFPTVLELAGVDPTALQRDDGTPVVIDGLSLFSGLRDPRRHTGHPFLHQSQFAPLGDPADADGLLDVVRDANFKYGRDDSGREWLYDLTDSPYDEINLLHEDMPADAHDPVVLERMRAAFDAAVRRTPYEPL